MIIETGKVVSVEADGIWVETIQRSTCGSCAAEKGCGQSLMARLLGRTSYLRVLLEGRDPALFQPGDQVRIGIPEDVVVKGSLFVYFLPLLAMIAGAALAHREFGSEGLAILGAVVGLLLGAAYVRWRAWLTRNDNRLQPVLMDDAAEPVQLAQ